MTASTDLQSVVELAKNKTKQHEDDIALTAARVVDDDMFYSFSKYGILLRRTWQMHSMHSVEDSYRVFSPK
jgi:hypothetical protein